MKRTVKRTIALRLRRLWDALPKRPPRTLPSRAAYALWAAAYPPMAHNRLMHIEQTAMLELLPPLAGRRVLDLACGSGRYRRIARDAGARHAVGMDNSAPMLHAALNAAASGHAEPSWRVEAEMDAIPAAAGAFDVVLCGLATGHLPPERMRAALIAIGRVLRPGGVVLLSDFHPYLFLNGGRRTFSAPDGSRYAVEHYPHSIADYFGALHAAGLTLDALREPCAQAPSGVMAPAILAIRAVKRADRL